MEVCYTILCITALIQGPRAIFFLRLLRYFMTVHVCELHDISPVILEDMRFHARMEVSVCT